MIFGRSYPTHFHFLAAQACHISPPTSVLWAFGVILGNRPNPVTLVWQILARIAAITEELHQIASAWERDTNDIQPIDLELYLSNMNYLQEQAALTQINSALHLRLIESKSSTSSFWFWCWGGFKKFQKLLIRSWREASLDWKRPLAIPTESSLCVVC